MKPLKTVIARPELDRILADIKDTRPDVTVIDMGSVITASVVRKSDSKVLKLINAITLDGKNYSVQAHSKIFPADCYY